MDKFAVLFFFALSIVSDVESKRFSGTIFANNWFKLWVNGKEVAIDPVISKPRNAVSFSFDDSKFSF